MKGILFPTCQSTSRLFLGGAVVAWWLMVSPVLQAQTNFNFNDGLDGGWEHFLPDEYTSGDYTVGNLLPSITFATNSISAGNMAYYLHAGSNSLPLVTAAGPRVGSFFTNGPSLTNFTMTGEFFHWTNGQSQIIAIAGRVQVPLPPTNPTGDFSTNSYSPAGFLLSYVNRRSHAAFRGSAVFDGSGGTDELRVHWINPTGTPDQLGNNGSFSGPLQTPVAGRSLTPDSTNGHYRLIFTASGVNVTGQIVDLSTGLPMTFSGPTTVNTNILRTTITNGSHAALSVYANVGGTYGFYAAMGDSPSPPIEGDPTRGQPIDPHFDNFAVVPGVVTLESAAAVTGPYAVDTTAGIEVYPRRITVPASGNARFYRIGWDHATTLTSVTLVGGNVVLTYD